MWRALKAELLYFWPWLLGGFGIAAFVVILLSVLVRFLEEGQGPPSFVIAMFPIIAGMVVSFVAQGYRAEERRARLLLAGPLTPRQLAGVTVLLPVIFVAFGVLAAVPMIGLATWITGKFEASDLRVVAGFAGQFWAYAQLGPLAQESSAARRQQRTSAYIAGWTLFVAAILVLAVSQFFMHSIWGLLGFAAVGGTTLVVAAMLYQHRTDFTR
ncbi:MAG: hypothetical protein LJE93_03980 [Acidobacteria bacterium]|jgi:hypothetical protein|nr:hypothetical protein [Acidobacteriota bacterium]